MAKDDELKESVKKPIKSLVKEIVSSAVYKLVKASAKKTVIELRDRLKEEAAHRLEETLREVAEKRLKQTAKQLEKEFTKDTPQDSEYISKIKQSLEKGFQPLSKGLLKPIIITCVCTLVVGGLIGWWVVYHIIEPTPPPPQPDLVITEITFDVENISETESTLELELPPELFAASIWLWENSSPYQVTIHYVIENQGDEEAGQSTSCLILNGKFVAEDLVDPIAAGGTAEGAFYDYPLSLEVISPSLVLGHIDIELRADAGNTIEESNEENNSITLKADLPCD